MVSAASSVVSRFVSDQSVRGSVVGVLRDSFTRAPRVRQLQVQLVVAGWLFHLITLFVSLARKARQIFEVSVSVCVCVQFRCVLLYVGKYVRPASYMVCMALQQYSTCVDRNSKTELAVYSKEYVRACYSSTCRHEPPTYMPRFASDIIIGVVR